MASAPGRLRKSAARDIIAFGRLLFERRLISGWGGNLSCRLGSDRFLITAQHAPLGFLKPENMVEIGPSGEPTKKGRQPSSETPMHLAVYRGTEAKAIVHAHPPQVLVFSLAHRSFVPLSFEEKYTIGEIPVIAHETPTVTDPAEVVAELRLRPIVILRGHGTVAIGKDLQEAFLLTDLLEEAVGCQFTMDQGRGEGQASGRPRSEAAAEKQEGVAPALFSRPHMEALIEKANGDAEFQREGKAGALTTTLTLQLEGEGASWTVAFDEGRITRLDESDAGEFLISGKKEWWEAVFKGRLDPFLATQQGKLKLERGELWKLSKWFKPFQRAFALWQTVAVK